MKAWLYGTLILLVLSSIGGFGGCGFSTSCITRPKETVKLPSDKDCSHTQDNSSKERFPLNSCAHASLRCRADDPKCLPIPYDAAKYSQSKTRKPIEGNPQTEYNGCINRGSCTHDGECRKNGCGNHCTTYQMPSFAAICPHYRGVMEKAFCGCVKKRCTWFTQPS